LLTEAKSVVYDCFVVATHATFSSVGVLASLSVRPCPELKMYATQLELSTTKWVGSRPSAFIDAEVKRSRLWVRVRIQMGESRRWSACRCDCHGRPHIGANG